MAGGKETPRQKMVGLMYLVLLALLALQVSSAIIQKFQFLNESIELSNVNTEVLNGDAIKRIVAAVEKNKNAPEDVAVLNKAKELRSKTSEIKTFIADLKSELILITGGPKDENGNYPGAKSEEPIAQVMIGAGEGKKGKGIELKTSLNGYVKYLNAFANDQKLGQVFPNIALDGKEDPIFQNDPDQKNKSFSELNFEATPLVAALAVLSEKEAQILSMESQLLNKMSLKVGAINIPVDKLRPVVNTATNYVVAGMEYTADMFMAAYSSNYKPKMTFKGGNVDVTKEGIGSVKFRAGASNFDQDGLSKQKWKGTISFPKSNGEDSIYTIEQDYYVVKPVIQVQSAAIQSLYKNCGNKLNISIPALGAQFNPEYNITGGTLKNVGNGKIMIVPTNKNVKIVVKNNGVAVGKLDFKAKSVPAATFETNLDIKRGVTRSQLTNVRLKAKATDDFKKLLPQEASYQLDEVVVYHSRNGHLISRQTVKGGRVNLSQIRSAARGGDRIVFEVMSASRKNYQGTRETAKINNKIIAVQIRD